jgi:hypothetical protein
MEKMIHFNVIFSTCCRTVHFYKGQNCTENDENPSKGNPFKEYQE